MMDSQLWREAAEGVDTKLQPELKKITVYACGPNGLLTYVNQKREECKAKQWTCKNIHGERVYIRDVLGKVAFWLQKVKSVGDIVSSFDPVHAALPWAGIRFLLVLAVSDVTKYGAIMESVEIVAGVISRYAIMEELYCQRCITDAEKGVRKTIIAMYTAVLAFLCKASEYFGKRSIERFFASLKQLDEESDILHQDIIQKDIDVKNFTMVVDKEILNDSNAHLGLMSESLDKIKYILAEIQRPMTTMATSLSEIHDGLKKEERMKILNWISTEQYTSHHKTIFSHRLEGTGTWLLKQRSYELWKYSTRTPFLWLNGGPGTGKSVLTSLVIDDIMRETSEKNGPPLAYFYCTRDSSEPRRADSTEIILSILRQLLSSGQEYNADESLILSLSSQWQSRLKIDDTNRLDQNESIAIITEICNIKGAYIIIDALDECSPKHRENLMDSLDTICQNSTAMVNVFISSRPNDYDIKTHFKEIPRVEISAKLNSHDIRNFVYSELDKKITTRKFLGGNPPQKLVDEVKATLIERADGLFRWVAAVIETLCASSNEYDVKDALEDLPSELAKVYDIIMKQIYNRQKTTGVLAKKVLYWILCAQQQLHTDELVHILSTDQDITFTKGTIRTEEILDWCCNLVKYDDEQQVIRFTHLSVREYLEKHPDFHRSKANEIVALACLKGSDAKAKPRRKPAIEGIESKTFYDYAMVYWPLHCANAGELRKKGTLSRALMAFLYEGRNAAPPFRHFLDFWESSWLAFGLEAIAIAESAQRRTLKHVETESVTGLETKLQDSQNEYYNPIFLACAFGFTEILEDEAKFKKLDATRENSWGRNPLNIAVRQGQESVVDLLTMKDYGSEDSDEAPLIAAVSMNREEMVKKLLSGNLDLDISEPVIEQALYGSDYSLVKYILCSERCEYFEPNNLHLQYAAQNLISGDEIIEDLLARNRDLHIEDETFEIACRNTAFGVPIITSLLQRNNSFVATEVAFENAAANDNIAIDLLILLSDRQAEIHVTESMIVFAANNKSVKPVEFLLRQDPKFRVSCLSLLSACRNFDSGDQILPLLLERSDIKLIDQRLLVTAMENSKLGVPLVKQLLTRTTREQLPITTEILIEATTFRFGEQLLEILLSECVGMNIHPAVLASAAANYYSPIEMVMKLCERDPPVEVTEEACISAVCNMQYAVELVEYLNPRSNGMFRNPIVLEECLSNGRYGYELVQQFWGIEKKPAVSDRAVETVVLNEFAEQILDYWYSANLSIPITPKALELAFTSPKAVEVFASLLKFNRKLQIHPRALCAAASNSTKGPVLIKRIFRYLGRDKCIANDQLFFAAAYNSESGGEVIKFLFNNFKYPKALTPALMECVCGLIYEPTTWNPLLDNAKAAGSITTDGLEYALRSADHVAVMLGAILDAKPKLQFSTIAWENLFASQRSADTMAHTFDSLAKHEKNPEFSERVLSSLMKRWKPSRLYTTFQEKAQEMGQTLPVTVEAIHAYISTSSQKTNPILEAMFRTLDEDSKILEMTNELYDQMLGSVEAEELLKVFENAGYKIPAAGFDVQYLQYALANSKVKDATLERLFHVTPEERKSFCRTEQGLIALIDTAANPQQVRKALSRMDRPLAVTTKVLMRAINRNVDAPFWLRIAAKENPREFPSLITNDLFVMAADKLDSSHELYSLSIEIGFDLPITSEVLSVAIGSRNDNFRLLAHCVIKQGGPDKLLSLLTEDCIANLPKPRGWKNTIDNFLMIHLDPSKVQALYSEKMMLAAAGRGDDADFIHLMYNKIKDLKPKEYYQDIADLYNATWAMNLLRAKELLDKGVDPNVRSQLDASILTTACKYNELSTVRLVLKYPQVNINIKDGEGMTPLMIAAKEGNYGIVEEIFKRRPEKHHRDKYYNKTAEELARWCGHYAVADMIRDNK